MGIPLITQIQVSDNGGAALAMMLGYYKRHVSIQEMRKVCISSRNGSDVKQVCDAAAHYGLDYEVKTLEAEELKNKMFPLLICWRKRYYCIVTKISKNKVMLIDPAKGKHTITFKKFKNSYGGKAIFLKPGADFKPGGKVPGTLEMLADRLYGYRKWLLLLSVFSAAAVVINIYFLKYKEIMVDDVMSGQHRGKFLFVSVMITALMLIRFIVDISNTLVKSSVSRKMSAESGAEIYKRLFRLPLAYYEKISRGEIMERMERNMTIDNTLLSSLAPRVFNAFALIFYVFLIFDYNVWLATTLISVYIIFSLIMMAVQSYGVMINRSIVSSNETMRSSLLNALNSIDSIKASGSEDKFFHLWTEQTNELKNERTRSLGMDAVFSMCQTLQGLLTSAIMLIMGAYLIIQGELTMGILSCIQSLFSSFGTTLTSLFSTTKQLQNMRTSLERINDIKTFDTIPEIPLSKVEEPDKLRGDIVASNLVFKYNEGDEPVLHDVSITIHPGEMIALVGASGCGKSTLMKLIAGMYQVQEGSITYNGMNRDEIPDIVFHSSIACVDQEVNMFADSVRANLKMWDETVEDFEMILACRDAQIHKRIIKNNYGYDSMISGNGRNYSGGEQQRLELARALAAEPSLMILDEFTSALDALTEQKVFSAIRDKNVSCLIAAHRFSTVVECDKIIVMDHGRIVEQGTHSELYAAKGLYYKLLCLQ
ncbi:MAG: peptidase domain-containing ABC transporter [Lachnospiraceae bacterium]|nr:peptidase domain-containing ABC transporter [Lachnospiraceae bacterium]